MKLAELKQGLENGSLRLELSTWGDALRGVGLYSGDNRMPIERIAIERWHCEQNEDIVYADKDDAPGWFYNVFQAGELSNKARAHCVDICQRNEQAILDYINGEYELGDTKLL